MALGIVAKTLFSSDVGKAAVIETQRRVPSVMKEIARRATSPIALGTQNPDGGWGQRPGMPSDPISTAYALLATRRWRTTPGHREGIGHLLARQQRDGGSSPRRTRPRRGPSRTTCPSWRTSACCGRCDPAAGAAITGRQRGSCERCVSVSSGWALVNAADPLWAFERRACRLHQGASIQRIHAPALAAALSRSATWTCDGLRPPGIEKATWCHTR